MLNRHNRRAARNMRNTSLVSMAGPMAKTCTGLWPLMVRITASDRSGLGSRTTAIKSGFSLATAWDALLSGRMFDDEQSKPSSTMSTRTFSPSAGSSETIRIFIIVHS